MEFNYGIDTLSVETVMQLAAGKLRGSIVAAKNKIDACRSKVEKMAQSSKAVYGVNTGLSLIHI